MPASLVALQILMILLPGFAAAYIVQMLALRGPQTDFDKVVEACLYCVLIYGTFVVLEGGNMPFAVSPPKAPATDALIVWFPKRLAGLGATALIYSLLATAYINLDGNWLFRKVKLTERTARRSIWNDIFQKEATAIQIVQVELSDGRSILGLLTYYSDSAEDCSVYVEQASWVDSSGSTTPIPGPGILLTKNAAIKSISLLES